jgi:alkaline phosphatase
VQTALSNSLPENNPRSEVDWNEIAQSALDEALKRQPNTNRARNVILFLGDGMGPATVTAGRIYSGQLNHQTGEEANLAFDKFPNVALSKTYNVDRQVADSAGTATAFLCGVKTNIGVIGVNQNVVKGDCEAMSAENNVDSILHWSLKEGKRVGVVTTTRITHATPAGAYAHSAHRDWESDSDVDPPEHRYKPRCRDIADQLVNDNIDINVILGGGRLRFMPNYTQDVEHPDRNGSRQDGVDLIQEWQNKMLQMSRKASYVWNETAFDNVNPNETDYLLGLFEPDHMQYSLDNDVAGEPTIAKMTEKAIQILSREPKGYFLLVEGGRIDHAHHSNWAKRALHDLVAMNEAVEKAVNMTDEQDTLIVVTADHSHVFTIGGYPSRGRDILDFTDDEDHPDVAALDGHNLTYVTLMYANGPSGNLDKDISGQDTKGNNFRQPSHVFLSSETHGGEDVGVYARGPMAHLFHGVQEQNYIPHVMAYASCVGAYKERCPDPSVTTADPSVTVGDVGGANHALASLPLSLIAAACCYVLSNILQ